MPSRTFPSPLSRSLPFLPPFKTHSPASSSSNPFIQDPSSNFYQIPPDKSRWRRIPAIPRVTLADQTRRSIFFIVRAFVARSIGGERGGYKNWTRVSRASRLREETNQPLDPRCIYFSPGMPGTRARTGPHRFASLKSIFLRRERTRGPRMHNASGGQALRSASDIHFIAAVL